MATAVLYGASSGALHAIAGPDHVLSLGPVVLTRPHGAFRVGLTWGAGHSIGTLLLAVPLLLGTRFVHLPTLVGFGDRLAGFALIAMAVWSLWSARRQGAVAAADARNPLLVGTIHGATGAGGLLLVVPMLLTAQVSHGLAFLFAFSVGSSLAMACLTAGIGKLGRKLGHPLIVKAQHCLAAGSIALGTAWLLGF
ncbi:MAG TPA: hypothetical protein VG937_30005 [Polyangiaceae bacterium]|nr:hypothetical protein [Polyangiaceae bacterium]